MKDKARYLISLGMNQAYADMKSRLEMILAELHAPDLPDEEFRKDAFHHLMVALAYTDTLLAVGEKQPEIPDQEWDRQAEIDSLRRLQ